MRTNYGRQVCMWRLIWDHKPVTPIDGGFRDIHVDPEPEWPVGRKGLALTRAWDQLGEGCTGALLCDGDVVADPADVWAMGEAINEHPQDVLVAPIKLSACLDHVRQLGLGACRPGVQPG